MRIVRLAVPLVVGGIVLLMLGVAMAATGDGRDGPAAYGYTDHPARVSTGRSITLLVDRDFSDGERQRIILAIRQWNYVLNGYLGFRASLLPADMSRAEIARLRQSGGWIVARVDSSHPIAHEGVGRHALAVTATGQGGGFVYVIADRIGNRDLASVVMHEFGHVLGAGHGHGGLMAPVYSPGIGHCIDHEAASLVATAQHLPLRDLNWCEPGRDPRTRSRSAEAAPGGR